MHPSSALIPASVARKASDHAPPAPCPVAMLCCCLMRDLLISLGSDWAASSAALRPQCPSRRLKRQEGPAEGPRISSLHPLTSSLTCTPSIL